MLEEQREINAEKTSQLAANQAMTEVCAMQLMIEIF